MMTDDLIKRLRKHVFYGDARLFNFKKHSLLAMEAADTIEALCQAIEKHEADKAAHAATVEGILKSHEAFKKKVSETLRGYFDGTYPSVFEGFIIPEPSANPLADAWIEATGNTVGMGPLNEALAKRGLKIVETGR